jgi:hypothetical protein
MFNLLIGSVITGSCDGCLDALNLLANPTSLLLVGATCVCPPDRNGMVIAFDDPTILALRLRDLHPQEAAATSGIFAVDSGGLAALRPAADAAASDASVLCCSSPRSEFLGEVWVNERGQRLRRPLTPRRQWLRGPAITEIDSPHFRG